MEGSMSGTLRLPTEEELKTLTPGEMAEMNRAIEDGLTEELREDERTEHEKGLKAREKLDTMVSKLGENNITTLEIAGLKIEIRRMPTSEEKIKMVGLSRLEKGDMTPEKMRELNEEMYELLASMSIDEVLKDPEAWRHLDKETGMVLEIFGMMSKSVGEAIDAVAGFRGKRGSDSKGDVPNGRGPRKPKKVKRL